MVAASRSLPAATAAPGSPPCGADLTGTPGARQGGPDALEAALTPRTRLVVLSHLLWNTGQLMPIAAVAAQLAGHPGQPWLLVDAAQSLGSLPVAEAARRRTSTPARATNGAAARKAWGPWCLSERLLARATPP